jgi:hypothetical protein
MASPDFSFRIPTSSKAFTWVMKIKDGGKNLSHALRLLIETHSDLFDTLYSRDAEILALKRKLNFLENQDQPDFRGHLAAEKEKLARIRKAERAQSKNDS